MKLVVRLLLTIFAFTTMNAASFDNLTASTTEMFAKNKYVASKYVKCTDSDGATKEDEVFFCFEKLTYTNLNFWKDYTRQQKDGTALKDGENSDLGLSEKISEGLNALIFSLRLCPTEFFSSYIQSLFRGQKQYDIWMSYSTRKDPKTNSINNDDIEMVMSVFSKEGCPFTSHIGISRNYLFCFPESMPHKQMAMQLHASAVVTVEQIYGHGVQSHMITRPTPLMAGLMAKKLISGKSVWINCDMAYAHRKHYIHPPAHSHDRFPLDNRYPNIWKLAVSEHDVRTFPRPLWFPHDGYTGERGEHATLGNHYFSVDGVSSRASKKCIDHGAPLVAVSMAALLDIWYKPVE